MKMKIFCNVVGDLVCVKVDDDGNIVEVLEVFECVVDIQVLVICGI